MDSHLPEDLLLAGFLVPHGDGVVPAAVDREQSLLPQPQLPAHRVGELATTEEGPDSESKCYIVNRVNTTVKN